MNVGVSLIISQPFLFLHSEKESCSSQSLVHLGIFLWQCNKCQSCENKEQVNEGNFWALLKTLSLLHVSVREAAAESVNRVQREELWTLRVDVTILGWGGVWLSAECRMPREKWCFCTLEWTRGNRIWVQLIYSPVPPPAGVWCHQNKNLASCVPNSS